MGKVGSSTLVASLSASPADHSTLFDLSGPPADRQRPGAWTERRSARKREASGTSHPRKRFHPRTSAWGDGCGRRIVDPGNRRKWLVITLVREPISRNVSSFFQNLEFRLSYDYRSKLQSRGREAVVADVQRLFEENYLDRRAMERIDATR